MSDALTYLMGNRWTKDAEGEFITVEDSYAVPPVSLSVDGKSAQVTTTGKNLLSDIPEEWVKRTFSGLSGTHVSFPISIDDGASYYYVNTATTGMSPGMYAGFCDTLEGEITVYDRVTMTNYNSRTFANTGNYPYLVFFSAGSSTTAAQLINQFKSYKIFLSTNSSDTYEVYSGGAASPRPDWPQPILSVDAPVLRLAGKNLMPSLYNTEVASGYGITWEFDSQGRFRNKDGSAGTSTRSIRLFDFPSGMCWPAGDYVFSYANTNLGYGQTRGPGLVLVDSSGNTRTIRNGNQSSLPFTLAGGERPSYVSFAIGTGGQYAGVWFEPMVRKAGTDADFAPYSGITVSNLLPDGYSLRSLPDGTKDELHLTYLRPSDRPGWAWYDRKLVKRVGCIEDMGTLSWGVNKTTSIHKFIASVPNLAYSGWTFNMGYCSCYLRGGGLAISSNAKDGYFYRRATYASILIGDYRFVDPDDLDGFKEFISGETFTYLLATPETISLDPIELPTMQSGLTNLWSDPSTNLSITYERDRNIVISNIKASIDDLATS